MCHSVRGDALDARCIAARVLSARGQPSRAPSQPRDRARCRHASSAFWGFGYSIRLKPTVPWAPDAASRVLSAMVAAARPPCPASSPAAPCACAPRGLSSRLVVIREPQHRPCLAPRALLLPARRPGACSRCPWCQAAGTRCAPLRPRTAAERRRAWRPSGPRSAAPQTRFGCKKLCSVISHSSGSGRRCPRTTRASSRRQACCATACGCWRLAASTWRACRAGARHSGRFARACRRLLQSARAALS